MVNFFLLSVKLYTVYVEREVFLLPDLVCAPYSFLGTALPAFGTCFGYSLYAYVCILSLSFFSCYTNDSILF